MGQALVRGITAKGYTKRKNLFVSDKDEKKKDSVRLEFKVGIADSNSELVKRSQVIILAVKPQDIDVVLQDVAWLLKGKLLISICAGISTNKLEKRLGRVAVVRVMPNMPTQIGQGISVISFGRYATAKDRRLVNSIFSCIGEVVQLQEKLMDAVTAISGSGPAYFFYLVENLISTARQLGIPKQIAQRLAVKTALGSAMLLNQSSLGPQTLRKQVTSKGGTTEAAFNVFKKGRLESILRRGFQAAAKRSKQLQK